MPEIIYRFKTKFLCLACEVLCMLRALSLLPNYFSLGLLPFTGLFFFFKAFLTFKRGINLCCVHYFLLISFVSTSLYSTARANFYSGQKFYLSHFNVEKVLSYYSRKGFEENNIHYFGNHLLFQSYIAQLAQVLTLNDTPGLCVLDLEQTIQHD